MVEEKFDILIKLMESQNSTLEHLVRVLQTTNNPPALHNIASLPSGDQIRINTNKIIEEARSKAMARIKNI